jgi:putative transposase
MGSTAMVQVSGKRSEAQWRALVSAFKNSGMSRRAFCARHGVALSTFDWWRKRLGAVPREAAAGRAQADALFVELTAPAAAIADTRRVVAAWDLELELGAGMVLRLRRSPAC